MKILVVTQSGDIIGGANRSLIDVLTLMIKKYDYQFICIVPWKGAFTDELEKLRIEYIVHRFYQTAFVRFNDGKDLLRFIKCTFKCLKNEYYAKQIKKEIMDHNFSGIYINDTTNTIGYLLSKKLGIPFVWHFRGYNHQIKRYLVSERELRQKSNGAFISISTQMKLYMENIRGIDCSKSYLVLNGVKNSSDSREEKWSERRKDGFLHCVQCGAISEAKGQRESVEALNILKKKGYDNIIVHFAGTPSIEHGKSYRSYLEKLITEYGLEKQIVFEGEVRNMASLRSMMNVELMCSVCEPFGRVTVEGMQAGLLVIGSNTGGTLDIIKDYRNGLLYEQGNPQSLAEKIIFVLNNSCIVDVIVDNAIKSALNDFSMDKNVQDIKDVFDKVFV